MEVNKKSFPSIIPDNDEIFLSKVIGVIESIDEYANLQITKSSDKYYFRLASSLPKYNNMLLEEILKLHNMFNIHLELSKSIKSSGTICFNINQ